MLCALSLALLGNYYYLFYQVELESFFIFQPISYQVPLVLQQELLSAYLCLCLYACLYTKHLSRSHTFSNLHRYKPKVGNNK